MAEWKFRIMPKGEMGVDPVQSQFFTTNDIGGLTTALVRESIQNSLDASLIPENSSFSKQENEKEPVKIRFYLSGTSNAVPPDKMEKYLKGLDAHINAPNNGLIKKETPNLSQATPFLLIEDLNTRGLEGDPMEYEDSPKNDGKNHNFYWFWRNVGRSGKGHGDRGRWGLGKTVFPAASKINTFYGLTVRHEDKRRLLMGQSVLKVHRLNGNENRFCPYGGFGIFEKEEFFVTPVELNEELDKFEKTFNIRRTQNLTESQSGLSIVIPYPSDEINASELIKSTVLQYFYPILSKDLEVTIEDEHKDESRIINSTQIETVIKDIVISDDSNSLITDLRKLFSFSLWSLNVPDEDFITFNKPRIDSVPKWKKDWYIDEFIKKRIDSEIENFSNGGRVAFKIPVKVHELNTEAKFSWFKVFMERDKSLEKPDCHFIRDGITITGIQPVRKKAIRALVVIDDKPLIQLLGDAENPAHTEWQKDSPHFKGKYINGDRVIAFVMNSLNNIYNMLIKPSDGLDEDALLDTFYVDPDTSGSKHDDIPSSDNSTGKDGLNTSINTGLSPLKITKVSGGIAVRINKSVKTTPEKVEINLGYMVSKGNPLKKYNELDFNLSEKPISINYSGVKKITANQNCLKFNISNRNFEVSITGFDKERDLFVKTNYYDSED